MSIIFHNIEEVLVDVPTAGSAALFTDVGILKLKNDQGVVTIFGAGGGGGGTWGSITGTLANQTDLQAALDAGGSGVGFSVDGGTPTSTYTGAPSFDFGGVVNTEAVTLTPRHGTAAAWTSANPVLANGELAFETDTGKVKFGDGVTAWTTLAYAGIEGPAGANGTNGAGVIAGGTGGQLLAKIDATDFNTEWVDPPTSGVWGQITGTLADQTDLQTALASSGGGFNPFLLAGM